MSKTSNREPLTTREAVSTVVFAGLAVGAMWTFSHKEILQFWLFDHLVILSLSLYALIGALLLWRLQKTKSREANRVSLLSKVWNRHQGVYVGQTYDGCAIHLPEKTRTGHVQIIGATGRGKTESVILPWFMRDLHAGNMPVLIDGKGEREIVKKIQSQFKRLSECPRLEVFDLGNAADSSRINPLRVGTAQQITDRLFRSLEFTDQYYEGVQFEIAGSLIELIHEVDAVVTVRRLYSLLTDDSALADAISKSGNVRLQQRLTEFLSRPRRDRDKDTMGLISQLAPFATGELAALVNGGENEFSLGEILSAKTRPKVAVVILLPTLLYQKMAVKLGKMLLQELAWAIAAREESRFTPVFLDEFSAFVYDGFTQILNKARSRGIALHLCHQSLGDLESVSQGFAKAINANTNVKCLLGLNDPTTADFFAKHLGTEAQEKTTERARRSQFFRANERTGEMSVREVEAYRVHPNELKHLMNGEGVIQFAIPEGTILEKIRFERLEVG